jgi:hypothetical protein
MARVAHEKANLFWQLFAFALTIKLNPRNWNAGSIPVARYFTYENSPPSHRKS